MAAEMLPKFFEEHDEEWLRLRIFSRYGASVEAGRRFEEQKTEFQKLREKYMRQVPDFLFANNTLRASNFEKIMYLMDWAFFVATPPAEFITCDNPALFSKGRGLGDKDAVIMFPLSRSLFLQTMWMSGWGNTYQRLEDAQIKMLNSYVVQNAQKQVYSSKNSKEIIDLVNEQINTH
jgi:hypothetical protein